MYPKQLNLDAATRAELLQYVKDEVLKHEAERSEWVNRVQQNNILYKSKPSVAGMPNGMSNIVVPLAAISVEAIHAAEMTTLFGLDQLTSIQLAPDWTDIDKSLEAVLDKELINSAGFYSMCDSTLLDKAIHGVGIAKTGWREVIRKAVRYIGDREESFTVATQRGAVTESVPVDQFLMPFAAQDEQLAPWVGERHEASPYQFKLLVESEFFGKDAWDKVANWVTQAASIQNDQVRDQHEKSESRVALWPEKIFWYELWLGWDVDRDNKLEEICIHYHLESDTILAVRYNHHADLRRCYRTVRHFPIAHRWSGIGVVEQVEQFQHEVSVIHRQRIDSGNIANLRMFKVRRMSGISADEPVYPGKIWVLDDLGDLEPVQTGEIYNSSYQNESQVVLYAQQRTGVNELNLGMPQVGTPGTAASDLARVQEGKKKFDYSYADVKRFTRDIMLDTVSNIAQFGISSVEIYRYIPNGKRVEEFLSMPPDVLRKQIILDLRLAGAQQNKILDRATWTQLAGMLTQYWTNMMALTQQAQKPELAAEFASKAMLSATEAMKQILESFDTRNIERIIADESTLRGNPATPPVPGSEGSGKIIQFPGMGFVNPLSTTVGG